MPIVLLALSQAQPQPQPPAGVVIAHLPASTRSYIGSPSMAILPSGKYVASHDVFGPGSTLDRTFVYTSTDRGKTWARQAEIIGQWWSTLFVHRAKLYLMGVSREYGYVVIRQSLDEGRTWSEPRDANSGLLLANGRYHCAPVPVLVHNGRIWRAMEDAMGPGGWGSHFRAFMMSAPVAGNLLKASTWTCSNRIARNPAWLGGTFGGWLEGNAVATPGGDVVDILRVDCRQLPERAATIRVSADGTQATFDPATGFGEFPGGAKKFTIRYDRKSRLYWSLANYMPNRHLDTPPSGTRNTLALVSSPDLRTWFIRHIILYNPDTDKHGFQYCDWVFDGEDIAAVVRTATDDGMGGAHNYHDANFLTFVRIAAFRRFIGSPQSDW